MKKSYPNEAALQEFRAKHAYWREEVTYRDIATFYSAVTDLLERGDTTDPHEQNTIKLHWYFRTPESRRRLKSDLHSIADAFRRKAEKGRANTSIAVVDGRVLTHLVLRTEPSNEVIVWSYWRKESYFSPELVGTLDLVSS